VPHKACGRVAVLGKDLAIPGEPRLATGLVRRADS